MIPEKTESRTSLRSHFSGNFRSGLKFPNVEPSNKHSAGDFTSGQVGPARGAGLKKIPGIGLGKNVSFEQHVYSSEDVIGRSYGKTKRTRLERLRPSTMKKSVVSRRMMLEEDAGGDGVQKRGTVRPSTQMTSSVSDQLSSDFSGGDSHTKPVDEKVKGKSKDIDTEISSRISSVYRSIETLAKKRLNFDNSIRAATRRTVADGARNKSILAATVAVTPVDIDALDLDQPVGTGRKNSKVIDVTRTYPKMFGLDPMKVIASSEDDSDIDEGGSPDPRKKTKKSIRKYLEQLVRDEQPRDMSAIMPTLSEKTFLTKLQKRESQLNKEINDMRNNLDVMNMKAEREAKKAQVERKKQSNHLPKPHVTRLSTLDPKNKGPVRELTEFLQATGGTSGGWDQDDHQVFIRAFQKWSNRPIKFVDHLTKLLPNKRPEEIIDHRNWYEKYEKLNNEKREHIRQWQVSKKKEHQLAFQMASESHNSRKEAEKRQQELLRIRRSAERERNKELLQEWKRSKSLASRQPSHVNLDNTERIAKMDMEMSSIRKEIQEITVLTRDIGKGLQTVKAKEGSDTAIKIRNNGNERARTAWSDASSGFCEMSMEEIEALGKDLEGDGEKFLRKRITTAHSQPLDISLKSRTTETISKKKLLEDFRIRDDELIQAKKKAILGRKEKMRNRAFLTDQEVKERMKKISTPSKFMTPTKGWMIRNEMRELEKVEARNKTENSSVNAVKESLRPVTFVNNIPKLGVPTWRKSPA